MLAKEIADSGGYTLARYGGELDAFTAPELRAAIGALARRARVVIDLSGVRFIDSAGLNTLVGGIRRIRETGGDVVVCSTKSAVGRTLVTAGLDKLVPLVATVDDALRAFDEGSGAFEDDGAAVVTTAER